MKFCAVVGCSNRSNRENHLRYFKFPSIQTRQRHVENARVQRRARWIAALDRADFTDSKAKNFFICSIHFVTGQPSNDPDHPDYVPSQNMDYKTKAGKLPLTRCSWLTKRNKDFKGTPIIRAKRNSSKKRRSHQPDLADNTVPVEQESVKSCDFTNKAAANQGENKPPTAKEKLRRAPKANLNSSDFDPLDLNNLLLSTTSIFQGMCKELELSTIMNKHVDYLNMDKERITLTTSAGNNKQSLQIVIVNKNPEDATPSFSESTDDLERMLTDVENTVMSAERENQEAFETRTISTQTENRSLEENKKLKLEIAALKNRILCLQNQIHIQDVPKLLVVCDDE